MEGSTARTDAQIRRLAKARLAIENVSPEIDAGRFAAKGVAGRSLEITADIFGDGHEVIGAAVMVRKDGSRTATAVPMMPVGNDRWQADFVPEDIGAHHFTISAWRDLFGTWHHDTAKKVAAGQDVSVEIAEARLLIGAMRARGADGTDLDALKAALDGDDALDRLMAPETVALMARIGPRANQTLHARELPVRDMGFDVLYFTPIHPIGKKNRKGRNNTLTPARRMSARPTPSVRPMAGTTRCIPNSARSRISGRCGRRRWITGWNWRSISPSSARPITPGSRSIPAGSIIARTARSNTPRTRRRSTRTSSTSISTPRTPFRACGSRCATSSSSG
jgi:hypothetical protein